MSLLLVTWRTWHFEALNCISHFASQSWRASRSFWSFSESALDVISRYSILSLANNLVVEDDTHASRSLMNIRKSRGPKTLPCGMPDVILASELFCPSTRTVCVLAWRKSLIQLSVLPWMPKCLTFASRWRWDTLSKAFSKSSRMTSVWDFLSSTLARSSMVTISWVSQDWCFLNPCWASERMLFSFRCWMMEHFPHFCPHFGPLGGRVTHLGEAMDMPLLSHL